jgi:hypothetical protein
MINFLPYYWDINIALGGPMHLTHDFSTVRLAAAPEVMRDLSRVLRTVKDGLKTLIAISESPHQSTAKTQNFWGHAFWATHQALDEGRDIVGEFQATEESEVRMALGYQIRSVFDRIEAALQELDTTGDFQRTKRLLGHTYSRTIPWLLWKLSEIDKESFDEMRSQHQGYPLSDYPTQIHQLTPVPELKTRRPDIRPTKNSYLYEGPGSHRWNYASYKGEKVRILLRSTRSSRILHADGTQDVVLNSDLQPWAL